MGKSRLLRAVCVILYSSVPLSAHAIGVSGQGTWESTLLARDFDGDTNTVEGYYDTVLDITWLADANYGAGSAYDDIAAGDTTTDGRMTWFSASAWADSLTLGGYTNWRLPTVNPIDGTTADDADFSMIGTEDRGYNISAPGTLYAGSTAHEMAHMFYNTLDNKGVCNPTTSTVSNCVSQTGYGLANTGPFSNFHSFGYWSETEYVPVPNNGWSMDFNGGDMGYGTETDSHYAWAVHDGDVGAAVVPVPAPLWLFGSGLLGLVGIVRKRA